MTPYLSSSLSAHHGFFGRRGGVSTGIYESLNAGLGSDDDPGDVEENRRRVAEDMGVAPRQLISNYQIHSATVEIVSKPPDDRLRADGLVTNHAGLALSVLSADCAPVLLEDEAASVIGACHAGWRGAAAGIVEATIAAMCELGASPSSIRAVVGPCIGQENYEVQDDFLTAFDASAGSPEPFIARSESSRLYFDLPGFVLSRLEACNVVEASWVDVCTYANEADYFSFRRNTHQGLTGYGRNISAIVLPS